MSSDATVKHYHGKLLLLRDLDSVIDFSKASNQLSIVMHLYNAGSPVSIGELARAVGDTRKSILDGLRKLERKGLVTKVRNDGELRVGLSEAGVEYVEKLLKLLQPVEAPSDEAVLQVPVRLNLAKEIITSINLYKAIIEAGLSKRRMLLVDELKALVRDEGEAAIILESFTRPPTRVFRLVKTAGRDALELDKMGLEILRRTPHFQAYRESRVYRVLATLTGTPWVSRITRRLSLASFTILALSLLLMVSGVPVPLVIPGLLAGFIMLSLSIIVGYIRVE